MDLKQILTRNKLSTARSNLHSIPWSDKEFSRRSLQLHLDQSNDINSRRFEIIDKQINWIHHHLLDKKKSKILDLACGPGLYTSRFAELGHSCIGIDISPKVIEYANKDTKIKNLDLEYIEGDILDVSFPDGFDFIILNFGWFNTFEKKEADILLQKIYQSLNSGGKLLLEPFTYEGVEFHGDHPPVWHSCMSGIFSDFPYIYLQESEWNTKHEISVIRYYIISEGEDIKQYYQYYQAYKTDTLIKKMNSAGFKNCELYDSIEDDKFSEDLFIIVCET